VLADQAFGFDGEALHRFAGRALDRRADLLPRLLQPRDLLLGFLQVRLERLLEAWRGRLLRELAAGRSSSWRSRSSWQWPTGTGRAAPARVAMGELGRRPGRARTAARLGRLLLLRRAVGGYGRIYGSLGAVVGLMVWAWLSSAAALVGAALNAELEREAAAGMPRR
jgi:hypothetical protein